MMMKVGSEKFMAPFFFRPVLSHRAYDPSLLSFKCDTTGKTHIRPVPVGDTGQDPRSRLFIQGERQRDTFISQKKKYNDILSSDIVMRDSRFALTPRHHSRAMVPTPQVLIRDKDRRGYFHRLPWLNDL